MSAEQEASTEALTHRWDPSGQAAVTRLEAFLQQGLPSFQHDRAKTDRESTTMLSPWIHFGTISVRHIYYRWGGCIGGARVSRGRAAGGWLAGRGVHSGCPY